MEPITKNYEKDYAIQLDNEDPLHDFRDQFYLNEGIYYFDGNSLGLASKKAEASLLQALESWKTYGIDGWTKGNEPWFYFSEKLGELTAPLLGAKKEEVIVTGSITSNLHQLIATFYRPQGKQVKILADSLTFPTDIYALKSQLALHGFDPADHLVQVKSGDGQTLDENEIINQMTDEVALVLLPSVLYRSGQLLDMERLTKAAHEKGIQIGFDLAHSVGALPHKLHDIGMDFAVWCNYKYLNSGPGGVGGLFVHENHFGTVPALAGWFSSDKEKQFDMAHDLTPAHNAGAFQMGTPHIFSSAPLLGSLEIFHDAGIERIREKSLRQTRYLMYLLQHELDGENFHIANPEDDERRGGHVFLEHSEAARICKALKADGVIPDFRTPNGIRLAPVALYTSYREIWEMVQILKDIMVNKKYMQYENKRDVVA